MRFPCFAFPLGRHDFAGLISKWTRKIQNILSSIVRAAANRSRLAWLLGPVRRRFVDEKYSFGFVDGCLYISAFAN